MANDGGEVYMLVIGRISDADKIAKYQGALTASGLYAQNDGHYVLFGRPLEMFEGEWPGNQAVVVAKFPSRDHARRFWYSEEYQERIKPLREGAGSFTVALLPAATN